jgi:hypothetical protein
MQSELYKLYETEHFPKASILEVRIADLILRF